MATHHLSDSPLHLNPFPFRPVRIEETELNTWFERDRAYVELRHIATNETIVEWWDGSVSEAIEDGFLNPRDYHASAFDYAECLGLLPIVAVSDSEEAEAN